MSNIGWLFESGWIGPMAVKNRLVMPPMVRNYAETDGSVSQRYLAHAERIARGGVGTMIIEASFVSPEGRGFARQLGLHADHVVASWRTLFASCHQHGVKVGPQLYHAGRQTSSQVTGTSPVAPSAIPCPIMQELPHELSGEEIQGIVADFGAAARRAKEAGADFIEIHAAHGYLVNQFMSPFSNRREDAYGGSFEGRMRFPTEVYEAIRGAVGEDLPIIIRISADEMVEGGIELEDGVQIARYFETLGVDAVHVSACNYGSYAKGHLIPPMSVDDNILVPLAEKVKHAVNVPVIAVGKIREVQAAATIVESGQADFVAIGRSLLADPDWPLKAQRGEEQLIDHCIACNQGCIQRLFAHEDVLCTVNPECGRETLFQDLRATSRPRRVVVVGAGPAGMSAARYAAMFGQQVILVEARERLGGQLFAAAASPHRQDWERLRSFLESELERLDVEVRINSAADAQSILEEQPDVVIVASGSVPLRPSVPDLGARLVFARDVMEGRATAEGSVIIAGGGCSGAQTAEYLAARGHPVTIVEASDEIAVDAPLAERALLMTRLADLGVSLRLHTRILEFAADSVIIQQEETKQSLKADTVLICMGSRAEYELATALAGKIEHIVVVGDAREPRRVTEAIAEGAIAALEISR
ncbi:MAG: FAD-dependent oxidoreductase [Pseudohongiellaceae bacterium]